MSNRGKGQGARVMRNTPIRLLAILAVSLSLTGCASYRNHGYAPSETTLSNLIVGRDTMDTVAELVGRPVSDSMISENTWFYVESRFRHLAFLAPEEIERQVIAISFDRSGRLASIDRYGLEDGRVVNISNKETVVSAEKRGIIAQLLHDIARGT